MFNYKKVDFQMHPCILNKLIFLDCLCLKSVLFENLKTVPVLKNIKFFRQG